MALRAILRRNSWAKSVWWRRTFCVSCRKRGKRYAPTSRRRNALTELIATSEEQTLQIARDLARSLTLPAHILLYGELGAGKTLFTKGLAEAFGVQDSGEVSSPTFTLINQYKGNIPIYHIDLYRIET